MAVALKRPPAFDDELIAFHNRQLWRGCLALLSLVALEGIVIAILVMWPRPAPSVIAVNDKGEPVGMLQPMPGTQTVADPLIRGALSAYIGYAFRIDKSFDEEKLLLTHLDAMTSGQAGQALRDYYHDNKEAHNPLVLGANTWQEVHIISVLKLSAPWTYEVRYQTITHSHNDQQEATLFWRASLHVYTAQPNENDPFGVYIDNLDFRQEQ